MRKPPAVSEQTPVRPRTNPVPRPGRVVVVGSVIAEVITHVEELADRVYCMRDGAVVKVRERS